MHRTRKFCTIGLLAVCAVLIGFNAMGHPLVDPMAIAGLVLALAVPQPDAVNHVAARFDP